MATFRCDNHVPEHILSAVTASQTVQGTFIELFGAEAVTVQATCTNGAAGTLYIDASNQLGAKAFYLNVSSTAVPANGSVLNVFSLVDQLTGMHKMRCRFISSAAGNVQVSVNARRVTY